MSRPLGLLLLALLLAGCTGGAPAPPIAPPVPRVFRPVADVPAPPADAPYVERLGKVVRILGLDSYMGDWFWSPDGSRLGFKSGGVIWSMLPDGSGVEAMVRSADQLDLVGWIAEGLVCTERSDRQLVVRVQATPLLGRVYRIPDELTVKGHVSYKLFQSQLLLLVQYNPAAVLDLKTGRIQEIEGWAAVEEVDGLRWTDDDRYLAYWQRTRAGAESLRIVELETVRVTDVTGAIYFPFLDWAPDHRWAAAVGLRTGSGNDLEERLSLSLNVGSVDGRVQSLPPPQRLHFTMPRPYWSPDGTRVAVAANGTDLSGYASEQALWVVDVATGQWTKVGTPSVSTLAGWADNDHLLLYRISAQVWLSVSDGTAETRPISTRTISLPDGSLVISEFQPNQTWTLFRQRPGGPKEAVLEGFGPPERLEVRGRYAALDPTEPGVPILLILPVD